MSEFPGKFFLEKILDGFDFLRDNESHINYKKIHKSNKRRRHEGIEMTGGGDRGSMIVGAYQICQRLGGGGEGDVFLVRHIPTGQLRAAKAIKSEKSGRQMHELHVMKQLHHPSLPQIIDVFQWEGRVWLIMEYIQGRALSDGRAGGMTGEEFFGIARELAEVLMYLHSRSIPVLHLDIKPSNILVKRDGHLVLIDFGAAVLFQTFGESGECFGTRGFAAPEQFEGAGAEIDGRADIYGYGATIYYCLYGHVPDSRARGRKTRSVVGRHTEGQQNQSFGRRAYWKHRAGMIAQKCLERDRNRRYPDFQSLYRDICRAEKRYIKRKRGGKILAAAAFLLFVLLFAAVSLENHYTDEAAHTGQRYDRLIEMAAGLGLAQSQSFYQEAARLKPGGDWGLVLLERLTEDYLFTLQEEEILKSLLYDNVPGTDQTVAEVMREQPDMYGEFSYELGLAYWYFYQEAGGKRAAASWFTQACQSQDSLEHPAKWLESAHIHADIGSYYEKLGRQDEKGRRQTDFQIYWRDLKRLWELESFQDESAGIKRQMTFELLSCLIMGAYDVRQSEEPREAVEQVLNALAGIVQDEQIWPDEEQRRVAAEQYRDAAAAVERVYADERGQTFEGEEKSAEQGLAE